MTLEEKMKLSQNYNTSVDTLRVLSKAEEAWIRAYIAENPSTPDDILRDLAKDTKSWVRAYTAQNSNTPDDVLKDLIPDINYSIRYSMSKNTKDSISPILVMLFEYENSLKIPHIFTILNLYENSKLPYIVKVVIETLYKEVQK